MAAPGVMLENRRGNLAQRKVFPAHPSGNLGYQFATTPGPALPWRLRAEPEGQVSTTRERFLKIGTRVVESVRRILVHLPALFPLHRAWRRAALALRAASGRAVRRFGNPPRQSAKQLPATRLGPQSPGE